MLRMQERRNMSESKLGNANNSRQISSDLIEYIFLL